MNVIERLLFKLAYYNSAVHRFNHYTTRTASFITFVSICFFQFSSYCRIYFHYSLPDIYLLDNNNPSILHAVLNNSWKQHPQNSSCMVTYLPSHKSSRNMDKTSWTILKKQNDIISDFYTWTHQRWSTSKDYMHLLCIEIGCHVDYLLRLMTNRDGRREISERIGAINSTRLYIYWEWCNKLFSAYDGQNFYFVNAFVSD